MKRGILLISLIISCCLLISPVLGSADVGNVVVKPSGDLEGGKSNVSADFQIDFTAVGGETIPMDENILLTTDLDNPVWSYSIVLDGVENARPSSSKKSLELTGWELSYKDVEESVKVALKGTAPKTDKSKEIQVVGVAVTSGNGRVKDAVKNVTAFVTNPGELKTEISSADSGVDKLKSEIAKFKKDGIDTSKAEKKLQEATDSLKKAESASYSNAQVYIKNADTFIQDAYGFLDMGVAQKSINDAKEAIDRSDEWITYFRDEKNLASDPRLAPIITKREFASEDISDAKELFDAGKYSEARSKAEEALNKATEVFDATQDLQTKIESQPAGIDLSGIGGILIYVVIAIILIIIVGFVLLFIRNRGGKGGSGGGGSFGSKQKVKPKKKIHQYDELF